MTSDTILANALIERGIGEIEAKHYEELVEKGKVLIIGHGDEDAVVQAETLLKAADAEKVEVH